MDYGPYMHRVGRVTKSPRRPIQELFPTDRELMDAAVAEEDKSSNEPTTGMTIVPSSPIPGSEWTSESWPEVYFDATRLSIALSEIAHDAQERVYKLNEALRDVRGAETIEKKVNAVGRLTSLYQNTMNHADTELKVRLLVNDLADTIEPDVKPEKPGWDAGVSVYPSMDRYYTLRPVWEFIANVRRAFKQTDA